MPCSFVVPCSTRRFWWGRNPNPARRPCGSWQRWWWVERWPTQRGWGTWCRTSSRWCPRCLWVSRRGAAGADRSPSAQRWTVTTNNHSTRVRLHRRYFLLCERENWQHSDRKKKLTVTLNAGLWRLLRFYGPPNMCVYDYNGAADRCEIAKCVCVKPCSIVYLFTSWHKSSKLQSYISSLSNEPHVYQTRMIALVVMSQPHNERGGVKWRENESRNMTASSLRERGS